MTPISINLKRQTKYLIDGRQICFIVSADGITTWVKGLPSTKRFRDWHAAHDGAKTLRVLVDTLWTVQSTLRKQFPWLGTDEPVSGADVVDAVAQLVPIIDSIEATLAPFRKEARGAAAKR